MFVVVFQLEQLIIFQEYTKQVEYSHMEIFKYRLGYVVVAMSRGYCLFELIFHKLWIVKRRNFILVGRFSTNVYDYSAEIKESNAAT